MQRITPISWRKYVRPIIQENQVDKERIWMIGKGLHETLRAQDNFVSGINWIYQPNARFRNPDKYIEKRTREKNLLKAVDYYRSRKQESTTDVTLTDTSAEGEPQK